MSNREDEGSTDDSDVSGQPYPSATPAPRTGPPVETWEEQTEPSRVEITRVEGAGVTFTIRGTKVVVGINRFEGPSWLAALIIVLTFGLGAIVVWLTLG